MIKVVLSSFGKKKPGPLQSEAQAVDHLGQHFLVVEPTLSPVVQTLINDVGSQLTRGLGGVNHDVATLVEEPPRSPLKIRTCFETRLPALLSTSGFSYAN